MTLTSILDAVGAKLGTLWPTRAVAVGEIANAVDGCFHLAYTSTSQRRGLDRRLMVTVSIDVMYFRADNDELEYLAWAQAMYDAFTTLAVDSHPVQLTDTHTDEHDRIYHFLFNVAFSGITAPPADGSEIMDTLTQTEDLT